MSEPASAGYSACAKATAAPIRSAVGGWVAISRDDPPRRVQVGHVLQRDRPLEGDEGVGGARQLEREVIRAALHRPRQAVADQADRALTRLAASVIAGRAAGVPRSGDSSQLSRCTASAAVGATIAA